MARVVMSFALDNQTDRRILHYLEGLPRGQRSRAIRNALEAQIGVGRVTLEDVYQAIKDLEHKMESGSVRVQAGTIELGPCESEDEPADVAANLDGLGL